MVSQIAWEKQFHTRLNFSETESVFAIASDQLRCLEWQSVENIEHHWVHDAHCLLVDSLRVFVARRFLQHFVNVKCEAFFSLSRNLLGSLGWLESFGSSWWWFRNVSGSHCFAADGDSYSMLGVSRFLLVVWEEKELRCWLWVSHWDSSQTDRGRAEEAQVLHHCCQWCVRRSRTWKEWKQRMEVRKHKDSIKTFGLTFTSQLNY